MQVLSSLRDAKQRHRDCQVVRRRGRIYVICKSNPRFKARQGGVKKKNNLNGYVFYHIYTSLPLPLRYTRLA